MSELTRQQHEAGASPEQTPNHENDAARGEMALHPHIPPAPSNTEKSEKPWYKTAQGWKTGLEITAIPFAIGYAVVTYCQWRDLGNHFEAEQRAWIQPVISMPDTLTEKSVITGLPISLKNIGKSVALRVGIDAVIELPLAGNPPIFSFSPKHSSNLISLMFPTVEGPLTFVNPYSGDTQTIISGDEIKSLINGDKYLVVFAQVVYRDRFGLHWTRACGWKAFKTAFGEYAARPCVFWNAVGDGPAPKDY